MAVSSFGFTECEAWFGESNRPKDSIEEFAVGHSRLPDSGFTIVHFSNRPTLEVLDTYDTCERACRRMVVLFEQVHGKPPLVHGQERRIDSSRWRWDVRGVDLQNLAEMQNAITQEGERHGLALIDATHTVLFAEQLDAEYERWSPAIAAQVQ